MLFKIYLLLQDVPRDVVDRATEVSPYNAIGYGLLVTLLIFLLWRQMKQTEKWQDKYISNMERSLTLLNSVENNMGVFERLRDKVDDLKDEFNELKVIINNQ